ncbi:glycoside hydrolase family 97 N-terminal domain-containing protein [Paenibacillus sp. V4I7]|uniref:glycoside hydrolase family 97 N-terminal domain-containing protein n=1 Tax=Paenibacillus sp. V4I7 TaxID=3042307 RepID=UPI002789F9EF|nr:glycoside hydrolase family 97 N-terminal domain-containing protein [Paenibacillus sp. V4I7]MDQ0897547.1 hypothetical protein [Paenibacillus sp. V4I7]
MWKPIYGERAEVDESLEEATICVENDFGRIMEIRLRAYSEGTAFQYFIPEQDKLKDFTITQEDTGFTFLKGSMSWEEHGVEGDFCVDHHFQYVLFNGGWYGSLDSANKAIDPKRLGDSRH